MGTRIYKNNGTGTFSLYQTSAESDGTWAVGSADLDNDGDVDYISTGGCGRNTRIYHNNGTGDFALEQSIGSDCGVYSFGEERGVVIFDADNDNYLDFVRIAGGEYGEAFVKLYINNGSGYFEYNQTLDVGCGAYIGTGVAGDIDNDGDMDIIVSPRFGGVSILRNNLIETGISNFTKIQTMSTPTDTKALAIGDIDNDDDLDIVASNGNIYVYKNNGTGNFSSYQTISNAVINPESIAFGDLNKNGYLDLIVTSTYSSSIGTTKIYENNGSGYFSLYQVLDEVEEIFSATFADIDNEGSLDLITGTGCNSYDEGWCEYYSPNRIYKNIYESPNSYLKINVKGTNLKDSVGTKLRIYNSSNIFLARRDVTAADESHSGTNQIYFGLEEEQNYTLDVLYASGENVICNVSAPKTFTVYENGSSTNDVICWLLCTQSLVNTTWSDWNNESCVSNEMNQSRNLTEYDENSCGTFENITHYEYQLVGPTYQNISWSDWTNLTCLVDDTMNQTRNLTQYDIYSCASNTTFIEYQNILSCDYCTPSLTNTSYTDWYNITLCQLNDTILQEQNLTQYDENNCGEIENITFYNYQETPCDYCTPSLTNTTWSDWTNISCLVDDTMNQTRNLTQYDENNCGEIENITFIEYQNIEECDYGVEPYCGDGICNNGETCGNCLSDCGECSIGCSNQCLLGDTEKECVNSTTARTRTCGDYDDDPCFEFSNYSYILCSSEYECLSGECVLKPCIEDWQCTIWSVCINSTTTRLCTDRNRCNTTENKPIENNSCECTENWECSEWSNCIDNEITRFCHDINDCGTILNKPIETTSCDYNCSENWECSWTPCDDNDMKYPRDCIDLNNCGTSNNYPSMESCNPYCPTNFLCEVWGECKADYSVVDLMKEDDYLDGIKERSCVDLNNCSNNTIQTQRCSLGIPIEAKTVEWCGEEYVELYDKRTSDLVSKVKLNEIKDISKINIKFSITNFTKYCDYCYDGIMDYDETGIDCGGENCPLCLDRQLRINIMLLIRYILIILLLIFSIILYFINRKKRKNISF
jgi:hypothetical protein